MVNKHTYIPEDAQIFCDFKIGNFCSVASGFKIISGQHPAVHNPNCVSNFPFYEHLWGDYPPCHLNGKVVIENDVWIGQDVSIKEDGRHRAASREIND